MRHGRGRRGPARTATAAIAAPSADREGPGDPPSGDATELLDLIIDQHEALGWHRQELEQTNQGVLALHAELAETTERLRHASDLQRRLLSAERAAHAAAEASRARLAFLAHAGAILAESLDHEQILGRLHAIVVPRYAARMTVWLAREPGMLGPIPKADPTPGPRSHLTPPRWSRRRSPAAGPSTPPASRATRTRWCRASTPRWTTTRSSPSR